ncbi:MAG TPA: CBS domain-containing protein [Actinomycetota bacterium]
MLGTLFAFAGGYYAGMKVGDRPIAAARERMDQVRSRTSELAGEASTMRTRLMRRVDVRTVRDVMTPAPETVREDTTLADAARTMERSDIGDVIVVDATERPQGIVTDRDIAIRAVAADRDPNATPVGDVMTRTVVTVGPDTSIQEALDLMRRHDIRRLPVVDANVTVGVVSLGDLSMRRRAASGVALADISAGPPNA